MVQLTLLEWVSHSGRSHTGVGNDSLLCMTNLATCCRPPNGSALENWFFPNGSRLPSHGNQWDFHRYRGQMKVCLNRRRGGEDEAMFIWKESYGYGELKNVITFSVQ